MLNSEDLYQLMRHAGESVEDGSKILSGELAAEIKKVVNRMQVEGTPNIKEKGKKEEPAAEEAPEEQKQEESVQLSEAREPSEAQLAEPGQSPAADDGEA